MKKILLDSHHIVTNKYRNIKHTYKWAKSGNTQIIKFDSKKEYERGLELIYLQNNKKIKSLEFQKSFLIIPKTMEEREATYRSDAYYFDLKYNKWIIEDTKSKITRKIPCYVIKRKLIKLLHPDKIFRET